MFTGDFAAHDMSIDTAQKEFTIRNLTRTMADQFPGIPVYVAIGNHETTPTDSFPDHSIEEYARRGPNWLYLVLDDVMKPWLNSSQSETIRYRGSYSTATPYPGLKLISINTNYCSVANFYAYLNMTDPDGTLQWLIGELLDAEESNDKVHIMGHIPPGDSHCAEGWAAVYASIVERFESTITAQFFGHTHYDQFQMYSGADGRAFAYNWVTPSLTTYHGLNPAFRIYTIDGAPESSTYTVLDVDTYFANLTESNEIENEPKWELEYKFKDFYEMTDLSPLSMQNLSNRISTQQNLTDDYIRFFYRNDTDCGMNSTCQQKRIADLNPPVLRVNT